MRQKYAKTVTMFATNDTVAVLHLQVATTYM